MYASANLFLLMRALIFSSSLLPTVARNTVVLLHFLSARDNLGPFSEISPSRVNEPPDISCMACSLYRTTGFNKRLQFSIDRLSVCRVLRDNFFPGPWARNLFTFSFRMSGFMCFITFIKRIFTGLTSRKTIHQKTL